MYQSNSFPLEINPLVFTVQIWTQAATQSLFQYSIAIGIGATFARFREDGASVNKPAYLLCQKFS